MKKKAAPNKMYGLQTGDYVLAAVIIVLSAIPILATDFFASVSGNEAAIYRANKLEYTVPLDRDRELKLGNMNIEVKGGCIAVTDSDCPQKICVHKGKVSKYPEKIVCVPNKVIIEIKNNGKASGVDAVAY